MRLIDADKLALKLRYMGYMDEHEEVQEVIDEAPTIDAVSKKKYEAREESRKILVEFADDLLAELKERIEVVKCKDCKWWQKTDNYDGVFGCCEHIEMLIDKPIFVNKDFFCADGERREE